MKHTEISVEFFPPQTPEGVEKLRATRAKLAELKPEFFSVTYGAGGSTRERTHATVARIVRETQIKPAAHLTCVAATREEIEALQMPPQVRKRRTFVDLR